MLTALIALAGTLFVVFANHRLQLWRERRTAFLAAGARLRAAFDPSLAFLEMARRHGSTHNTPDASSFLASAFAAHAEAVNSFAPFVKSKRRLRTYQAAWNEYCELAHDGGSEAVFIASTINDRDPWSVLEGRIRAILKHTEPNSMIR